MFWKKSNDSNKNPLNSDEYERLVKRLVDVNSDISLCKVNIRLLETNMENLRGKFNVKIGRKELEEKKPDDKPVETIINNEFVAFG